MNQTDDKKESFPEGYEQAEARLDNTKKRLQAMDERISTIPKDQGPALTLEPPGAGFMRSRQQGSRDQAIKFLEGQKAELKADTLAKTEQDTRGGDNKAGRVVRDRVREELFPNRYRNLDKAGLAQEKAAYRDMEDAQDYMDAKLVQGAAIRKGEINKAVSTPEKKENDGMSMSARFSMSLGYTQSQINTGRSPDKTLEPGKE